ncbi:hypothetical protein [Deinococcus hopiensis]|uniref:hypothetical protein n=1 Tax=Deinococcus hopiensis TaxID=309885 RepID=UPI0009FC8450|nr:hypothetical protein [Deinococcus hopiensis]
MGRLRPHSSLAREHLGLTFRAPVGLAAGLDVEARAARGLVQFGFGFLEFGPVSLEAVAGPDSERLEREEALRSPGVPVNPGMNVLKTHLVRAGPLPVPRLVRLAHRPGAAAREATAERLALLGALDADVFPIDVSGDEPERWGEAAWQEHMQVLIRAAAPRPLLLAVPPDLEDAPLRALLVPARQVGVAGVLIKDARRDTGGGQFAGPAVLRDVRDTLARVRPLWETGGLVIAGGVHTPGDALALLAAGADLVQVRARLVYSGPALAQQVHETLAIAAPTDSAGPLHRLLPGGWPWAALLGLGMILGGLLAIWVGLVWVVLPYDEAFVGLNRGGLAAVNPHLLDFMGHDRQTLAGTLLSIGAMYLGLAAVPLRRGEAWACDTLWLSGGLGFLSFFLFLGYGYFDPLHAWVATLLLVFFALGLSRRPRTEGRGEVPDLTNDACWRRGLWGQLLFVATGAGLVLAGLTIAGVGVTSVFVPQDLAFMHTTAQALQEANGRLMALIAHDRAGFGGALASDGVTVLLSALWGYRRGACWLWWTLLAAGTPGFTAALWVHGHVGYTDPWHLAPAVIGLALYVAALITSFPFLNGRFASPPS